MKVELFNIARRRNTANKIKDYSPLYSGEVEPYGGVTNDGTSFVLERLYNANYGRYQFGDKWYYCFVDIQSHNNELYTYRFTVDGLSTVYYAGGFNSNQFVLRDSVGDPYLLDREAPHNAYMTKQVISINDVTDDIVVILNVLLPINTYAQGQNEHYVSNNNITSYILTPNQYQSFVHSVIYNTTETIDDADIPNFVKSIISSYVVDKKMISDDMIMANDLPGSVTLAKINTDDFDHTATQTAMFTAFYSGDPPVRRLKRHIGNAFDDLAGTNTYTTTSNIDLTPSPELLHSTATLYIKNIGNITFKFADLGITSIGKVGYSVGVNFTGGTVTAYLNVNGTIYKDYKVVTQLREQALLPFDSSITLWTDYTGSVLSTIGGVVATVAGIATENYMMAAGGLSAVAGGISGIAQTEQQREYGGYSIIGSLGGYDDFQMNLKNSFISLSIQEQKPDNGYQARFGKPMSAVKNLSTLTGYIRTERCEFAVDLPSEIVTAAETACNEGVYVV